MAKKPDLPRPTDAELAILRVLWDRGAATVREVMESLATLHPPRPMGYTTALKFMQIMWEKGLVKRDESGRTHIYRATDGPDKTRRSLVGDLAERAFGGSAGELVLQALGSGKVDAGEIASIRALLDELEGRAS